MVASYFHLVDAAHFLGVSLSFYSVAIVSLDRILLCFGTDQYATEGD
jgi:hypothetical protein